MIIINGIEYEEDKRIYMRDARRYFSGCVHGWKIFIETHGYVWRDVVLNGLLAIQLLATNDAMAISLVELVYNETMVDSDE